MVVMIAVTVKKRGALKTVGRMKHNTDQHKNAAVECVG